MKEEIIEQQTKGKPKAKIEHLINWYHGNFCVKHEESTREHYEELKKNRVVLEYSRNHT